MARSFFAIPLDFQLFDYMVVVVPTLVFLAVAALPGTQAQDANRRVGRPGVECSFDVTLHDRDAQLQRRAVDVVHAMPLHPE